jgi:hypothetical protein
LGDPAVDENILSPDLHQPAGSRNASLTA